MNIPRPSGPSLFDMRPDPVSLGDLAVHLGIDVLVAASYVLLIFMVVFVNRAKHVSIYVPRKTYLITFLVVLALTALGSVGSVLFPNLAIHMGYKIFIAGILLAVVLAVWRVLPRHVDPVTQARLAQENAQLILAQEAQHAAQAELARARQEIEQRVEACTAKLSAEKLSLEKEIIERRLAAERAEESKRRLDELIMRTNTAVVFLDDVGQVLDCNHALAQVLGRRTVEEITSRRIGRLFGLRDETEVIHFINETLRIGTYSSDIEAAPPARGAIHVEAHGVASVLDGRPCIMALFRDVTERKSSERELLRGREAMTAALDVARKANATRSDFLAKMNHELRTPLNGIIGLSEVVRHKAKDEKVPAADVIKLVSQIHTSGRHLLSVVDDLLDLSRLDSGTRELSLTKITVRAEIDAAVMTLATIALQKRIVVINRCDPNLEWTVDQRAFKQIIINLVNNAVKFSPPGSQVEIEVERRAESMALHIRDEGPGVAEEERERILVPFARGEFAETKKIDGVGLGLTIVSELLKLQGGKIEIDSQPGKGATFTAVFPAGAGSDVDLPKVHE